MKRILVGFVLALLLSSPGLASKKSQKAGDLSSTIRKAEKLLKRDELRRAVYLLETELKKTGWQDFDALHLLARIQLESGRSLEALAAIGSMVRVAEGPERRGEAYLLMGKALYQSPFGQISNPRAVLLAERAFWLNTSSNPKNQELSKESIALAQAEQPLWRSPTETLEEAASALEKAIELQAGRQPAAHYHLAEVLALLGRPAEASVRLDEYFAANGSNGVPLGPNELRCWLDAEHEIRDESGPAIVPPRELDTPTLRYRSPKKKYTVRGGLRLRGVIDEQGRAQCLRPLGGLPEELAQQAVKKAESWTFEPATLDGRPIAVRYDLTLELEAVQPRQIPVFQVR